MKHKAKNLARATWMEITTDNELASSIYIKA